ncbi:MAG: DUF4157 domain-containing protein [Fluviicola sp.]|nr:DUF4157 domain-containing protein [Fluviicola sp.]
MKVPKKTRRPIRSSKKDDHKPFLTVQAKMLINQPNDTHEVEADKMADTVVSNVHSGETTRSVSPHTSSITPATLQRAGNEEDAVPVQSKEQQVASNTATQITGAKSAGTPLGDDTRNEMETGFGADFSKVKVHTGTDAERMSEGLNAQAFTHENDIFFNKGKYDPKSKEGKHLLAHELTHTIQQKGMVQKKVQRHMQTTYPWDGYVSATYSAALRKVAAKTDWIADIPKGTRLTVIGNSGNWIKVRVLVNGIQKSGYMSQELVSLSATDGVANEMQSMVGQKAKWKGSAPSLYTGAPNTFVKWAEAKTESKAPVLSSVTVINCWEMVLLAAYRSGAITWDFIHKLYLNTTGNWGDELPKRLTSGGRTTYDIVKKTPKLKRGELVFFDGASHVALATGNGDEILTFWPPPNTAFTAGGTIDAVKVSTIKALYTYMKNDPNLGTPKITIGKPIW